MAELINTSLSTHPGLKLYYRYEESSGTAVTDWSNSGNGGIASRTNILNNSGGEFGKKGLFASASSDKITITDATNLRPTGVFSIGSWINMSGNTQTIFQSISNNSSLAGIQLSIQSAGKLRFWSGKNTGTTQGTDYQYSDSSASVNTGSWVFCVGTWDGATLRTYVNGAADGATSWANAPAYAGTNYIRVGCGNNTGTDVEFINGSLDDTFIFNGLVLSTSQIMMLYSGGGDKGGLFLNLFI